jgi:hypothetical protein
MNLLKAIWTLLLALLLGFATQAQQRFNNLTILSNLTVNGSATITNATLAGDPRFNGDYATLVPITADTKISLINDSPLAPLLQETLSSVPTIRSLTNADYQLFNGYNVVSVEGYATAGDGGGGQFRRVFNSGQTIDHRGKYFAFAGTTDWILERIEVAVYTPEMFGAVGDGSTDDTTALQAVLTASAGRQVILKDGAVYKVTSPLTFATNSVVIGFGATVNYTASGNVTGHLLNNYTVVDGGTWNTLLGSSPTVDHGGLHTVFNSGDYITGVGANGWVLKNVVVSTEKPDANAIFITGDSYNFIVESVTAGDTATMGRVVLAHWGGANAVPPTLTTHPHNGTIRGITVGDMTYASDTAPVLMSAVYGIKVSGVSSTRSRYGAAIYGGDWHFQLASDEDKKRAQQGNSFDGVTCAYATVDGLFVNGASAKTNVVNGAAMNSYIPVIPVTFENCSARGIGDGTLSGTVVSGIKLHNVIGPRFVNCSASAFQYGASFGTNVSGIVFDGGRYSSNRISGIQVSDVIGSTRPNGITITHALIDLNGWGTSGASAAGIVVGASDNTVIDANVFGNSVSEINQEVAVRGLSTALGGIAKNNNVVAVKSGGVGIAFSLGSSTDYNTWTALADNRTPSGVTAYTGVNVRPFLGQGSSGLTTTPRWSATSLTEAPTSGTWQVGDKVWFPASVSGPVGAECVTAGTPGTWRYFGFGQSITGLGDTSPTLTAGSSTVYQRFQSPLTADRTVTLSTSGAVAGSEFVVTRGAGATGAYKISVGTGPLIDLLEVGDWVRVKYSGSTWVVVESSLAVPATSTLSYSGTTVTLTAGAGREYSHTLVVTNDFTLSILNSTDGDHGTILCWPAVTTNCTVTLSGPMRAPAGGVTVVGAGSASAYTNYTAIRWHVQKFSGTNVITVTPYNYNTIQPPAANGYKTIVIPASFFAAAATSPATATTRVNSTNNTTDSVWSFSGSADNYITGSFPMPEKWDGSTLKAKFFWRSSTTSTNVVTWNIATTLAGDGDQPDIPLGDTESVSDAGSTTAYLQKVTGATDTIAPSGTPFAAGDTLRILVGRDGDGDGNTDAALLEAVVLQYRETATEPSAW